MHHQTTIPSPGLAHGKEVTPPEIPPFMVENPNPRPKKSKYPPVEPYKCASDDCATKIKRSLFCPTCSAEISMFGFLRDHANTTENLREAMETFRNAKIHTPRDLINFARNNNAPQLMTTAVKINSLLHIYGVNKIFFVKTMKKLADFSGLKPPPTRER